MNYGIYVAGLCLLLQGWFMLSQDQGSLRLCRRSLAIHGRDAKARALQYKSEFKEKEWIRRRKEAKMDREIYEGISFLRNMTVLGRGRKAGADFIIEKLSQREGVLQPVYMKMLSHLRLGRREEAIETFTAEVPTVIGKEFGGLLMQWDDMDPAELTEILISHQKNIRESKITAQRKHDEMISDLIYMPVVINVFLIFINFIYVAYFLEQQEMLKILF